MGQHTGIDPHASLEIEQVSTLVAAGTSDVDCTAVDMQDYESVAFVGCFGTLTSGATTAMKIAQSSDNGVADGWSDLTGSSVTVVQSTGSGKAFSTAVVRPTKRYVRCTVTRGVANAVINSVVAVRYGAKVLPVPQASLIGYGTVYSPAEGTA